MFTIHTVTSGEAGLFSNTHLIETDDAVVVIDPPMLVHDAEAAHLSLQDLGKPLAAIVYTHPHPDHVNGGTLLRGDTGAPVFATRQTDTVSRKIDGPKRDFWTKIYGEDYPRETTYATVLVDEGPVDVGPLTFRVHDIGAGECATGALWILEHSDTSAAFTGDLAYNDVHPWLFEGRSNAWLAQLAAAEPVLKGIETLYPGHGTPAGPQMLALQADYIRVYQQAVRDLAGGRPSLTDTEKAELEEHMIELWPSATLISLITMSADPVAAELASDGR